jgi:hypothetical protein
MVSQISNQMNGIAQKPTAAALDIYQKIKSNI